MLRALTGSCTALLLAFGMTACSTDDPTDPSSSPEETVAAPIDATPEAQPDSVDCDPLEDTLEQRFEEVIEGAVRAWVHSEACTQGFRVEEGDIYNYFSVQITQKAAPTASDLQELVADSREIWTDPEVQAVAPNVAEVQLTTDGFSFTAFDGFEPLDAELAELLEQAAASPYHYSYRSAAEGIQKSGVPIGTFTVESLVAVHAGNVLEASDPDQQIADAWSLASDIADHHGWGAVIRLGGRASVSVSPGPGEPLPADLAATVEELNASSLASFLYVSLGPDAGELHYQTSAATTYEDLDAQTKGELDRLAQMLQELGLGDVRITAHPPVE